MTSDELTGVVPGTPGGSGAKVYPEPGPFDLSTQESMGIMQLGEDGKPLLKSSSGSGDDDDGGGMEKGGGGGGGEVVVRDISAKEKRKTFDPDSEFFRNWDIFTTFLLLFTAIVTPFEVAFLDTDLTIPSSLFLFIVNRLVDLGFVVDMGFTFFLPYLSPEGNPVVDLNMIARKYFRGWFSIDLASILPFDTLTAVSGSSDGPLAKLKSVRIVRLLRLMKLLRVLRGMRIFARLESRIEINYAMLSLQQFVVGLFVLSHWLACTFMMLHDIQWDQKGCSEDSLYCTWLMAYESNSYNTRVGLINAPTGVKYVICVYWALGEITGVGDLPGPTNTTERVYLTVINIFCVFVNAMIIGGVVAIIEAINSRKKEFHDSMDNLNAFLREKNLKTTDRELCTRLRQYYLFKQYHGANDAAIWEDVLVKVSPTLQGEVAIGMHGSWMKNVPYFQGIDKKTGVGWTISDRFRVQVALSISSDVYAPFEPIYDEFSPSDGLMVVERGLVGCDGRLFRKGGVFGQDVFLNEAQDGMRGHNSNSLSHSMILKVPGDCLHELLAMPQNENVRKQVRRRICAETMKSICMRMEKYLRLASDINISPFAAVQMLEKEFGKGVFSKVPMMRQLWNQRRVDAGDQYIKCIMILQRAVSTYKFKLGVKHAVKLGGKVRAMRVAKHALEKLITAAGLDPEDYIVPLVANNITPAQLAEFSPETICLSGIKVGDAVRLHKALKTVPAAAMEAALMMPTPKGLK